MSACSLFQREEQSATVQDSVFVIAMKVSGDSKEPVKGAEMLIGKRVIGTADDKGQAQLKLQGQEGDTASVTVRCPKAYSSPSKPFVVGLRHLAAGSPPPKFEAQCVRMLHTAVVVLRAENGANLPIYRLGQKIGQSDDSGTAHLLLELSANQQVTFTLDTSGNDLLRPPNPNFTFVSGSRDEMVLWEQKLTLLKRVVHVKAKARPAPL